MRAIRASLVILFMLFAVYLANAQGFDFEGNMSKGKTAFYSGQYELAIKYLEPCEKKMSQCTMKVAQEFANSLLDMIAYSHAKLGNYKKAIELGMSALKIQKQLFGESHPYYATSLSNLASYYSHLEDYTKAIELGMQALEIRKRVLGESSSGYAASLNNLSTYYAHLDNYTKAIELGTQALEIRKRVLGESHPAYASSLRKLADY